MKIVLNAEIKKKKIHVLFMMKLQIKQSVKNNPAQE